MWTGRRAKELGLIDGLGDLRAVMRDKFGERVKLRRLDARQPFWRRRFGLFAPAGGAADSGQWAQAALAAVEERLIWGRFGL